MKIPRAIITHLITDYPVARLATLQKDGTPHQVPIVFVWLEGRFWSPIDGKPKTGKKLQRITNVLNNPHGSLIIDNYDEDWTQLWWIRVAVELSIIRLDESPETVRQSVTAALLAKYPQYASVPVFRDPPTLLSMKPHEFVSWSANREISWHKRQPI